MRSIGEQYFNFTRFCHASSTSSVASNVDGGDIRDRTIGRNAAHTFRLVGAIIDMDAIENGMR
jgi:hypothetical protein